MGYIWALLAAIFWGCIGPFGTYCMRAGLSPVEVAFWRALFGGLFFVAHVFLFRMRAPLRAVLLFAAFGLVGVGAFFSLYQVAVAQVGSGLAAVLLYTAPAWVAVFSKVLFREELDGHRLVALALAMGGAGLACLGQSGFFGGGLAGLSGATALGIACGLAAGFCYSLHYVFTRKFLGTYPAAMLYACCMPAGALCLLPFVDFAPKSVDVWLMLILGSGFLTCYAAYSVYCAAMKRLSSTRVAVIATLEPIAAAAFAALWWNEQLTGPGIAGGLLVVCGAVFAVFGGAKKKS